MDLTVNQAGYALRRFESYPLHSVLLVAPIRSSWVEMGLPSRVLVDGGRGRTGRALRAWSQRDLEVGNRGRVIRVEQWVEAVRESGTVYWEVRD
jgi:hypothetical protein